MKLFYTLMLLLSWSALQAQSDFFRNEWIPRNFTPPDSTMDYTDTVSGDAVTFTVNTDDTLNLILPTITGNNLPAWRAGLYNNYPFKEHVRRLDIRTMRIPGGNWSNTWLWDGINHWDSTNQDGYSGTFKQYSDSKNYLDVITSAPVKTWTLTTDKLLEICRQWDVEPQICVNYALARYIDAPDAVEQAAHYAAEWVRYVKAHGYKVKYWEIGNEHYGSWEAGYDVEGDTLTGAKYGRDACVFIDSMKAADPSIKIGIVVYPGKDYWSMPNYTPEVLQEAGDKADFLITHDYFTWAKDPNDITYSAILKSPPKIAEDYNIVQDLVRQYTSREYIPVAMTEYNYFAGLKQTEGVALLFFAHALGEYMKTPYGLVNYWDIQNGSGEDDHGMFTYKETGVADDLPHPSFFPYYLHHKMVGDVLTADSGSTSGTFIYSTRFSNDHAGIIVINETSSPKSVTINIPGYTLGDTVYRYELSTDTLSSRKVWINGLTSPDGELYGPREYYAIAPYGQPVTNNAIETGVKKYSVNYFVVQLKDYTAVAGPRKEDGLNLKISPNPASGSFTLRYHLPEAGRIKIKLYNVSGKVVKVLEDGISLPGSHARQYDLNGITPGIYLLQLESDQGVSTQKLIIK